VLLGKGVSLYETRKFEEALRLFNQVYELDPKCFEGVFNTGVCHFQLKRYGEAY
jgi:superkiller protein 3